jgi:hypothetical protein
VEGATLYGLGLLLTTIALKGEVRGDCKIRAGTWLQLLQSMRSVCHVGSATLYGLGLLLMVVALKGELRGSLRIFCEIWYLAVAAGFEVCVPSGECDAVLQPIVWDGG